MLDQMQLSSVALPLLQEKPKTYINRMPEQIVLGHVTLTNDCEEFLQGLDAGMMCYCETDYERTQMTARELLSDLRETMEPDGDLSLPWRLGFLAGQVAGLLNPDLAETTDIHSFVEVLSRKCKVLYPGPDRISGYVRRLHEIAGIETLPEEEAATIS